MRLITVIIISLHALLICCMNGRHLNLPSVVSECSLTPAKALNGHEEDELQRTVCVCVASGTAQCSLQIPNTTLIHLKPHESRVFRRYDSQIQSFIQMKILLSSRLQRHGEVVVLARDP